jgi:hypothetical protein
VVLRSTFVIGREPLMLRLSYAYEQATHHRAPPKTTPPLTAAGK